MAIVSYISTVSYRYYDKRSRFETARRVRDMHEALGYEEAPSLAELNAMPRGDLIHLALRLHSEFPED